MVKLNVLSNFLAFRKFGEIFFVGTVASSCTGPLQTLLRATKARTPLSIKVKRNRYASTHGQKGSKGGGWGSMWKCSHRKNILRNHHNSTCHWGASEVSWHFMLGREFGDEVADQSAKHALKHSQGLTQMIVRGNPRLRIKHYERFALDRRCLSSSCIRPAAPLWMKPLARSNQSKVQSAAKRKTAKKKKQIKGTFWIILIL